MSGAQYLNGILDQMSLEDCNTPEGLLKAYKSGYAAVFMANEARRQLSRNHIELEEFVLGGNLRLDTYGQAHRIVFIGGQPDEILPITGRVSGKFFKVVHPRGYPQVMTWQAYWHIVDHGRVSHLNHIRLPRPETVCPHCHRGFELDDLGTIVQDSSIWYYPPKWEKKFFTEMEKELKSQTDAEYYIYRNPTAGFFVGDDPRMTIGKNQFFHGKCHIEHLCSNRQRQFEELLIAAGFCIKETKIVGPGLETLVTYGPWYRIVTDLGVITLGLEEGIYIFIGLSELPVDVRQSFVLSEYRMDTHGIYVYGTDQAAAQLKKIFEILNQPSIPQSAATG